MTTKTKENTMNKKNNKLKKFYEYMTIGMATVGTLSMVSAVGAIETNQWLLGASAVTLGITSYALSLYSQILYSEAQ